ncbi:O-methyltransferase [Eudoraea sp.]|uniref:O-methyltransferase n=1 Tax=Eudoraea sp. TaxID=1979955 RepID=UPI003C733D95
MNEWNVTNIPEIQPQIAAKCKEIGFPMPSDPYIGSLLKTLITSKPNSNLLELGTGIGLSLSWMLDGMDSKSRLTTIDNDQNLIDIAKGFFGTDNRINSICADGEDWILKYSGDKFDLIFADAWPGKYSRIDQTLDLVKSGGFYIIDDMILQANWPDRHEEKVKKLIDYLENREDFNLTKLNWSTGVIIATRKY